MKKLSIILSVILAASIILLGIVWKTTENKEKRYQLEKEPFIKEVTDEDVVVTGDTAYVDCQILVNLEKISARRKLEKWIKEDGGIIVGEIPVTNTYQIEFPEGTSKDDLESIPVIQK